MGWVTVGHDVLNLIPQLRDIERQRFQVPGVAVRSLTIDEGRVAFAFELEP